VAQFEREMMLERQREGIAKAKVQGKYKGRKPTARAKAQDALRLFKEGKKVAHIASELGIGRVYRALESTGQAREAPLARDESFLCEKFVVQQQNPLNRSVLSSLRSISF
jgi:DNA invertase Pin-like site-specific DNA recombinase